MIHYPQPKRANLASHLLVALGLDEKLFLNWQTGKNQKATKKGPGRKHNQGNKK